jgi:branched-chain amino acid transport system substrate-binding protein
MLRAALVGLAIVAAACTAPAPTTIAPTPSPTHEPGTYAVTAFLDLSGTRSPRGDAQRSAMQQWTDSQRGTPRLKLRIVDVAGSDARLLIELKRAADASDTDAFVVGVPATIDDALASAIALVKRPVLFTLPIAEPTGDAARWTFGLAPAPDALARVLVDALPSRSTPAVIVTNGTLASGREEVALTATFRSDGRPMPFVLSAAPEQRDTFDVRSKPFFSGAGAAVFFVGPALGYLDPQRIVPAAAVAPGYMFLSYLTDASDASRLGEAAPLVRWPGLRRPTVAGSGTHATTAADALALLAASADAAGDPERTRARIEGGTFAGIATTYAFTASRHAGVDPREIALLAWQGGRVVIAR